MGDGSGNARRIARIAGPSLVALGITEAVNIGVFAQNPAPVIYLNGAVLFVAGVAIVQAQGRWARDWTVLVTLTGWALLLGGLYRMAMPAAPQLGAGPAAYGVLSVIATLGAVLTLRGYAHQPPHGDDRGR